MNIFKLFKSPNKWSPAHLNGLHIEEQNHIDGATIVDDAPEDDDQGN